ADNKTVNYGTAPVYTSVITGLNDEDVDSLVYTGQPSYSPPSSPTINAGGYPLVPSALNLIQPSNYVVNYVPALLSVLPVTLTATADNKVKQFGSVNPALTITYSGFLNGDGAGNISQPAISTLAGQFSPVGTYTITLTGGSATNYVINRVNGTLTILPATTCTLSTPSTLPICGLTGNVLAATVTGANTYAWTLSGTDWQITGGQGTASVEYTAGNKGTTGTFTLTVSNTILTTSSVCTLQVVN